MPILVYFARWMKLPKAEEIVIAGRNILKGALKGDIENTRLIFEIFA